MVILPNHTQWDVANWVARGFLEDARACVARYPLLVKEVEWCLNARFYTLDLEEASPEQLEELARLVDEVIRRNEVRGAEGFQQPEMLPVYLAHLRDLRALVGPANAT
jgi:hypothetical protein